MMVGPVVSDTQADVHLICSQLITPMSERPIFHRIIIRIESEESAAEASILRLA